MDNQKKEIKEAIRAGEEALSSLENASSCLNSARNWGIADMFGGGLFVDMIKHSKMNEASHYMEDAKYKLQIFRKELGDVTVHTNLKIDIGGFLNFADFFFDGIIADYLVQSKIAGAKQQVESAISQVKTILSSLRTLA